jgi:hypothetical protein
VAVIGRAALALLLLAGRAGADADAPHDGYCDFVEGAADAESDLLYAPSAYGGIGYVKSPTVTSAAEAVTAGGRVVAGLSYNFIGILQGNATRDRGRADCRRHQALDRVQGETLFRALDARLRVFEGSRAEGERILAQAAEDLRARRATVQDVVALRLRMDELRDLAADTRRQLEALPAPSRGAPAGGALAAFYQADAKVEEAEGRLRWLQGIDVSLRVGYDRYLDRDDSTPIFALLSVTLDLGTLFQGADNERAATGRRTMVREQHQVQLVDTTVTHLKAEIAIERQRADETALLAEDLERQMAQLDRIGGDENRRHRETVWFEWVKVKAQHAFLETHVASLHEAIGEVGP